MPPSQDLARPEIFDGFVELVPVGASRRVTLLPAVGSEARHQAWINIVAAIVLVVVPTVLAAVYYFGFAADRYVSETKFTVRKPASNTSTLIAEILETGGVSHAPDDAFAVDEYIRSRDAMQELRAKDGLDDVFSHNGSDFRWALPSDASNEERYQHYLKFVSTTNDGGTGIGTIRVEAFRPEDAQRIAGALLSRAEALINRLNDRAAADSMAASQEQADALKKRLDDAQAALVEFRTQQRMVDPAQASVNVLQIIAMLSIQLAETQSSLDDLEHSSPQSPQISALRRRIAAIQNQIATERKKLGGGDAALAETISKYESLVLEREFSEKAYSAALAAVQMTESENRKSRVYLEKISEPQLSDSPDYPRRGLWVMLTFLASLFIYWTFLRFRRPA